MIFAWSCELSSLCYFFFGEAFLYYAGCLHWIFMYGGGELPLFLTNFRSRLHTYDDVVERVACQLGLDDPSKIRLTSHNCYSQQPKPQPIKYRGVDHLSDMLVHYNQVPY